MNLFVLSAHCGACSRCNIVCGHLVLDRGGTGCGPEGVGLGGEGWGGRREEGGMGKGRGGVGVGGVRKRLCAISSKRSLKLLRRFRSM